MTIKEMMKEFIENKMNGDSTGLIDYIDFKTKEYTYDDIRTLLDIEGICYEDNDSRKELVHHIFGQLNLLTGRKILAAIALNGNSSERELYKTIYVREYL